MSVATRTNEPSEGDGDAKGTRRDSVLPCFSLASVSAATENFSMQCKLGEGGFGPVYKVEFLLPTLYYEKYCLVKNIDEITNEGKTT